MDWRTERQLTIILAVFVVIAGIIAWIYFAFLYQVPTCTDRRQNQGEEEADCGGPCVPCAVIHRKPVSVLYSRFVEARPAVYDVVAEIVNPNDHLAANPLAYRVRLYDSANAEVGKRENLTFLYSNERIYVVESSFYTERKPVRAVFEPIEPSSKWAYFDELAPEFTVGNKRYASTTLEGLPGAELTADITNRAQIGFNEVEVRAVLLDDSGNIVAAAKTVVRKLKAGETKRVTLTWPEEPEGEVSRIDVEAAANGLLRTNLLVY